MRGFKLWNEIEKPYGTANIGRQYILIRFVNLNWIVGRFIEFQYLVISIVIENRMRLIWMVASVVFILYAIINALLFEVNVIWFLLVVALPSINFHSTAQSKAYCANVCGNVLQWNNLDSGQFLTYVGIGRVRCTCFDCSHFACCVGRNLAMTYVGFILAMILQSLMSDDDQTKFLNKKSFFGIRSALKYRTNVNVIESSLPRFFFKLTTIIKIQSHGCTAS